MPRGTNAMALIQAIRSSQAAFLCTADKLQCGPMLAHNGTYWLMLAFSFLHISFIGTIAFSGSIKFFHLKIALGLALGKSWPLLSQPQRNTDVHRQTCINHHRDVNYCKLMGTNAMALIQAIRSSQAAFLCTADKLQCWPMLACNDTCWLMLACSFLHISFIGTISSVVLSSSFI